jgi:molecular chaperone DnaJ
MISSASSEISSATIFSAASSAAAGGGGGTSRSRGVRGSNLRVKIKLNYEEIAKGVTKNIKVKKYVSCTTCSGSGAKDKNSVQTCSTCGGSGQVRRVSNTFLGQMQTVTTCPTCNGEGSIVTAKCAVCKGEGRVYGEETVTIDIPAGVQEGMQLSVGGRGNAGERGGAPGDLIILIEEEQHPDLHRDGLNVAFELHISFSDAVFGLQAEVPTIDGKAKIKIPPGTQSGKIFRLKGKGFPGVNLRKRRSTDPRQCLDTPARDPGRKRPAGKTQRFTQFPAQTGQERTQLLR